MTQEIEISELDLRYESHRMKNPEVEAELLSSISQRGIEEPLEGVDVQQSGVLLNGFKRYRCARRLHIHSLPYLSLGSDEVTGIVNLLRIPQSKALNILEQAGFVDELDRVCGMCVAEIAAELSRSKAWVSMRLGLIAEMSSEVSKELFAGRFPVYSYMYTLRPFMRMNGVKPEQIDQFVTAVSAKKLSVREIEQLANGFFRGPESFRQEILEGNLAPALKQMKETVAASQQCSDFERILLKDLELTQSYMQRVMGKSRDSRIKSRAFHAQSHLLTAGILSRTAAFTQSLKELHDRNGQA